MRKIFAVPFFAMLIVLAGTGCAQNNAMNYGRALTPAESEPPPVKSSPRTKVSDSEPKWYDGFGWHWTGPGRMMPPRGYYERTYYRTNSYHWGQCR